MPESHPDGLHARSTILPVCADHLGRDRPWHAEMMKRLDRVFARSHLTNIGETYKVDVHWVEKRADAEAHVTTRQVWLPRRMRRPAAYLFGMHEFGHVLSPLAIMLENIGNLQEEMACEAAAWGWAFENAAPELLELMQPDDWAIMLTAFYTFPRATIEAAKAVRMVGG